MKTLLLSVSIILFLNSAGFPLVGEERIRTQTGMPTGYQGAAFGSPASFGIDTSGLAGTKNGGVQPAPPQSPLPQPEAPAEPTVPSGPPQPQPGSSTSETGPAVVAAAEAWMDKSSGSEYDNLCWGWVKQVLRDGGILDFGERLNKYHSAHAAYQFLLKEGVINEIPPGGIDWSQVPPGAVVFWDTTSMDDNAGRTGNDAYGHVAIFYGLDDQGNPLFMTTTGWNGESGFQVMTLDQITQMCGKPPTGWVNPDDIAGDTY
ncbi:MAG: hypothetical protein JXJ19_07650 [Elusimicrobia bacterium]|nr:hypothetical protein [Elusimicrobiota bacterium]